MDEGNAISRLGAVVAGKWTLEALLGEGGLGAVYRARHTNGNVVAIKVLHATWTRDKRYVARFEREAKLANRVGHPAVVRIFDDGVMDDGSPFLVSELIVGETLEAVREESGGKLPLEEVMAIADTLLHVLEAAHAVQILHRDLKPENLMRTPAGELRVLDFGLARDMSAPSSPSKAVTSMNAIMGTVGFMAPEQAQGRWDLVDAATDVWAAGATILRLATGLEVHEGDTPMMRLGLAATRPAPKIGARATDLPEAIASVLDRSLAFSKEDRFRDAASFRRALDDAHRRTAERSHAPEGLAKTALDVRPRASLPPTSVQTDRPPAARAPAPPSLSVSEPPPSFSTPGEIVSPERPPASRPSRGRIALLVAAFAGVAAIAFFAGRSERTRTAPTGEIVSAASRPPSAMTEPTAPPSQTVAASPSSPSATSSHASPAVAAPTLSSTSQPTPRSAPPRPRAESPPPTSSSPERFTDPVTSTGRAVMWKLHSGGSVRLQTRIVRNESNVADAVVRKAIDWDAWSFLRCYDVNFGSLDTRPEGTVNVTFQILDQLPRHASVQSSTFDSGSFNNCVVSTLQSATINAAGPNGNGLVVYGYRFLPN